MDMGWRTSILNGTPYPLIPTERGAYNFGPENKNFIPSDDLKEPILQSYSGWWW